MEFVVVFSPEAEAQLLEFRGYISERAGPRTARSFTDALVHFCIDLSTLPRRGVARDDLRSGLRTISFRGRVTVAYAVGEDEVTILAMLYAGRDVDAALRELGA